ncbi:EamA family transporter (plasmid) [Halorussus salilacus]|uniref:EamA family transporter n=1 Tax=Halorussus salilacus TaxID=2953750 RepID=UPI00209C8E52|nr:EamA family transporter [Halorussus salilacus]USZ69958.1 EamA family transporter [Halorussus salilacus]
MTRTALLLAGVGMVSWGVWAMFADLATRTLDPAVAMVISYLAGIGIAVGYIASQGLSPTLSGVGVGYAVAGGLFSGVGAVSYYAALQYGASGIVTTVTALYFVVAAVLGAVFLGESVGLRDAAAIALAVGAVALLST